MKRIRPVKKLYIVRKYVMATSAKDAIKLERRHTPDDVWLDDDWRKLPMQDKSSAIGFMASSYEDEYYENKRSRNKHHKHGPNMGRKAH